MSSSHNNLSNHPASFGLIVVAALLCALAPVSDAQPHASPDVLTIRRDAWLRILRAEDKRLVDSALLELLGDRDAQTRRRAALALGRIGESSAIAPLASLLANDEHMSVRGAAAFAIGEIEALEGVAALRTALHRAEEAEHVRARATEALGKIAAALAPEKQVDQLRVIQSEITKVLSDEAARSHQARRELALAAITAALRARMSGAALTISEFLASDDARVRADAANTLARLRARVAISRLEAALDDSDAIVRANAARALGVAQSRSSAASLTALVSQDADERVRVSAIRALAAIKDERALTVLLARAESLFSKYRQGKAGGAARPSESNELLEIASALGGVAGGAGDGRALQFLKNLRAGERMMAPELEVAWARISPPEYVRAVEDALSQRATSAQLFRDWRIVSATGQGLGEVAQLTEKAASAEDLQAARAAAQRAVASLLNHPRTPTLAMPDLLRAFAAFKTTDAGDVFAQHLAKSRDVMVRATAAELIGELPPSPELSQALAASLQNALADAMNDASLAVLDALGKQKDALQKDDAGARRAIKAALAARDHLIRRRAARLLQTSGAGDGASSVGVVEMNQTTSDYERALARLNRRVTARIFTDKGSFAIELLPREAPLTVDSFIKLARRGFFNDLTFHRVVPNFVIQGGDPRGDGNGGPLYQIRCEINETPYERGAVGMALSGKDTGGSQWFVTHAPQPHLDGGYTVFGRVVEGMDVVDAIVRGDRMRRVTITESKR